MKASLYQGNKTFTTETVEDVMPKAGEVRVKVAYCGVCGSDLHLYHGAFDKRIKSMPHIAGHEISGVITELAEGVTKWNVGDRVVVRPLGSCGECLACRQGHSHVCSNLLIYGIETPGGFASSWTVPADIIHEIPDSLSMEHGALIEPVAVVCHANQRGGTQKGDNVVVIGGGPIGILTAMVARYKGANVIISEVNESRLALAKEMGFDAISPINTDVIEYVFSKTNGDGADIIFDVAGVQAAVNTMTKLTHPHSKIVVVAAYQKPVEFNLRDLYMKEVTLIPSRVYAAVDFEEAIAIINEGGIDCEKVISGIMPLSQVKEAMDKSLSAEACKILIDCQSEN